MMIPKDVRQKAFNLYCVNIIPVRIANILGIKPDAVYQWVNRYDWESRRNEINKYKEEASSLSDKEQDLKIVESVLAMYSKAIKENQGEMIKKMNYKDVMEAVKLRRLLKGESTENINLNNPIMDLKKLLEEDEG